MRSIQTFWIDERKHLSTFRYEAHPSANGTPVRQLPSMMSLKAPDLTDLQTFRQKVCQVLTEASPIHEEPWSAETWRNVGPTQTSPSRTESGVRANSKRLNLREKEEEDGRDGDSWTGVREMIAVTEEGGGALFWWQRRIYFSLLSLAFPLLCALNASCLFSTRN